MKASNVDDFVVKIVEIFKSVEAGDETECLSKTKDLLNNSVKKVNAMIVDAANLQANSGINELDAKEVFLELPDAQFLEPRGRFKTSVSSLGIHLTGKQHACFVSWDNVTHAVVVPASQTTKKEGEDYLAMRIKPGSVLYNNKPLNNLLWNLGRHLGKPIKVVSNNFNIAGIESDVVTSLVTYLRQCDITKPRAELFQTVSQTSSKDTKPYLRCYKGIQEGVIYPLECGIVFVKPILFLPAEEIASITAGRGGGSGQTRYVDFKIETVDENEYEFTNIEREELPALQGYVKGFLEKQAELRKIEEEKMKAEKKALKAGGEDDDNDDDDDSDEDDDDYDPDAPDSDEDGSGSGSGSGSEDSNSSDDDDESYASEHGADADNDDDDEMEVEGCGTEKENSSSSRNVTSGDKLDHIRKKNKSPNSSNKKEKKIKHEKIKVEDVEMKVKIDNADVETDEEDIDALMRAAYQSSKRDREETAGNNQELVCKVPKVEAL